MFDTEERIHEVNISDDHKKQIKDFLQGSVYCWCKNKKDHPFHLRDLLGGDNEDWTGTPLIVLYKRHIDSGNDHYSAMTMAAQDAGWLLKKTLDEDLRKFHISKDYTNSYQWIP